MRRVVPKLALAIPEWIFWIWLTIAVGPWKAAFVAVWIVVLLAIIYAFLTPERKDEICERLAYKAVNGYGLTLTAHERDDDDDDDEEEEKEKE